MKCGSLFSVLDDRERLIAKLAVLAGMRPGRFSAASSGRGWDRVTPTSGSAFIVAMWAPPNQCGRFASRLFQTGCSYRLINGGPCRLIPAKMPGVPFREAHHAFG